MLVGVLAIVVAASALWRNLQTPDLNGSQRGVRGRAISLRIDPTGQKQGENRRFDALGWHDGMTVLDAMHAASLLPGGLTYETRGSGELTFVARIDGVENETAGTKDARSWIFYVNGTQGTTSAAATRLEPSDTVLWNFQVWE